MSAPCRIPPGESRKLAIARATHPVGTRLLGDRGCSNCGRPLFEHCIVHLIPCCPGKCPGRKE